MIEGDKITECQMKEVKRKSQQHKVKVVTD